MALITDRTDRSAEAVENFQKALALSPTHTSCAVWYGRLGTNLQRLSRHTEAITACTESIIRDPTQRMVAVAFNSMGLAHDGLGQRKEALAHFEKSISIHPECNSLWNRSTVYRSIGKWKLAIADALRGMAMCPNPQEFAEYSAHLQFLRNAMISEHKGAADSEDAVLEQV
jgi:tetratricopeptide (TPR) repeat protein